VKPRILFENRELQRKKALPRLSYFYSGLWGEGERGRLSEHRPECKIDLGRLWLRKLHLQRPPKIRFSGYVFIARGIPFNFFTVL